MLLRHCKVMFALAAIVALCFTSHPAFAQMQELFVSSRNTNQIIRYNGTTGDFIDAFAIGSAGGALNGLTFGPDGNLYVGDELGNNVKRYNGSTGAFINDFI